MTVSAHACLCWREDLHSEQRRRNKIEEIKRHAPAVQALWKVAALSVSRGRRATNNGGVVEEEEDDALL